MQDTPQTAAWK